MEFKTKETFLNEIEELKRINGCTVIEAICDYAEKYGLDFDYIAKNLISVNIYEELEADAGALNMLKPEKEKKLPF